MLSNVTHPVGTLLERRYRILRAVGDGGYGVVYEAEDTRRDNCRVAVKSINLAGLTTQQVIEATAAFNREVVLLSKLRHYSLPSIHDHFTDSEHWYMVMDFIEGETLESYITYADAPQVGTRRLPLKEVLEIGMSLSTVLSYLHTQEPPVIFRDLKPANVMRADDGHLFLIDFGIARRYKDGQDKDTIPLGSPGYAAPEQYGKAQTTARADIYSLGATLHQLVSGDDPSETPFHFAPLTSLSSPGQPFVPLLDELIQQMVEMDVSKRPTSMTIVKRRLQQLMMGMYPPPVVRPAPRARTFHVSRRTVTGTLLTMLVVGGMMGMMSHMPLAFENQDQMGPQEIPPAPQPPANQALFTYRGHQSQVSAVAWSPKHSIIASGDALGNVNIWDAATGVTLKSSFMQAQASTELTATPNNTGFLIRSLSWSPDGQQLAIAVGNGTVYIWEMRAKLPVLVYSNLSTFTDVAWSPDGRYIAASDPHFHVLIWMVNREKTENIDDEPIVLQGHTDVVRAITWSPDSRSLATGSNDNTLRVWDVVSGKQLYSFASKAFTGLDAAAWSPTGTSIVASGSIQGGNNIPVTIWPTEPYSEIPMREYDCPSYITVSTWSPNGELVASCGNDGTVQVWQAFSGQTFMIYTGHYATVNAVSWSPDGQYVASGDGDGTVQVWSPYSAGT